MSILIDENTNFIIQGITGREAVTMVVSLLEEKDAKFMESLLKILCVHLQIVNL